MKLIEFKHQNIIYVKKQPQYMNLPALKTNPTNKEVVSCWKMSPRERIHALLTGKVYASLMTLNEPITPFYLSPIRKKVYVTHKKSYVKNLISEIIIYLTQHEIIKKRLKINI